MTVVVGYVPDATGFLAVTEGVRQARWRGAELVVVNVVDSRGYVPPTAADEVDLDAVERRLAEEGVAHRIEHRTAPAGASAEVILEVA